MEIRSGIQSITGAALIKPPAHDEQDLISVSTATRRVAFAYERLRNTMDAGEEHILRQKAIQRIITRRLEEGRSDTVTARALLRELIRAHYIDPLPKHYIAVVANIIAKVKLVLSLLPDEDTKASFLRIAAVEVDRMLYSHVLEDALTKQMYDDVYPRLAWNDEGAIPESLRPQHVFVASYRALFSPLDEGVFYHSFTRMFPTWKHESLLYEEAHDIAEGLPKFFRDMRLLLAHPMQNRLWRLLKPAAVPYRILGDMMTKQLGEEVWQSPDALKEAARKTVGERKKTIRQQIWNRTMHSIAFLLVTKSIMTLLLEVTYEVLVLHTLHWGAFVINLLFHPLLLFVLGLSTRLPGKSNTEKVAEQVYIVATGDGVLPNIGVHAPRSHGALTVWLFTFIYTCLFMGTFYGLFLLLRSLNFSLVAVALFVMFLGLASYLAFRIRRSVADIRVIETKEGLLTTIGTFLSLPILEFGRWLATQVSQLNVVLYIMDLIIEAPFKLLIDVFEEWMIYIRERKDEIA